LNSCDFQNFQADHKDLLFVSAVQKIGLKPVLEKIQISDESNFDFPQAVMEFS